MPVNEKDDKAVFWLKDEVAYDEEYSWLQDKI